MVIQRDLLYDRIISLLDLLSAHSANANINHDPQCMAHECMSTSSVLTALIWACNDTSDGL